MTTTDQENARDSQLLDLLKDYPAPKAPAGFFEQAIDNAVQTGARRKRRRWLMGGIGSAVAATLAVWVMSGTLMNSPQLPQADDSQIPSVMIALEQPQTINLMFASATALDSARLTVLLPDGIELDGFPGQREISWETSLVAGKNRLPLKLLAVSPIGGELLARLEHEDRNREFKLRIDVS